MIHVRALRGATTLDNNSISQMNERVPQLLLELLARNSVDSEEIISILFISTPDLTCMHPATAARGQLGFDEVPMSGAQELDVPGSVERCVRILMHVETGRARSEMKHVYLHGAASLRPDLADGAT